MSLSNQLTYFEQEQERLRAGIDERLQAIMELAEGTDPAGANTYRARALLREIDCLLVENQANEHDLDWARWKAALIGRCTESARLQ